MALDLKIEIFACSLFRKIWSEIDKVETTRGVLDFYEKEIGKVENVNEVLDNLYIKPVICNRELLRDKYLDDFTDEYAERLKYPSQCYNYLNGTLNDKDFFDSETIFEQIFATCAFVLNFCIRILKYNKDIIEYVHMFWALYFDKHTEEFYESGGWPELKASAEKYSHLYDIFCLFKKPFPEVEVALDRYYKFLAESNYFELKDEHGKKNHVSKLWIKFRIKQYKNYVGTTAPDVHGFEIQDLLASLKEFFDMIEERKTPFEDIECLETNTDHSDNEINAIDVAGIEHSSESNCDIPNTSEIEMHENLGYKKLSPHNSPDETIFCSGKESGDKDTNIETTLEMSRGSKNGEGEKESDNGTSI